jgi:hypothetical protein
MRPDCQSSFDLKQNQRLIGRKALKIVTVNEDDVISAHASPGRKGTS